MLNLFWFFLFLFKHLKKLDPAGPDIVACEDPTEKELEANDETDEQAHRPSQQFGHVHLMMNGRNCKVISVKISSFVDFHLERNGDFGDNFYENKYNTSLCLMWYYPEMLLWIYPIWPTQPF